ncbi:regulator of Ty1 Transposition [Pestalotiopsis sp. IQ-011]
MRDMKNSDPRGKGLLNLIVGAGGTRDRPNSFDAVAWGVCPEVAKDVIGNLRELWFLIVKDRSMNRSVPARTGSFTLLKTDPRHIDPHLQHMALPCRDLSKTYKSPWQQLENSLGVVRSEPLQIRYALQGLGEASTDYPSRQIIDRVRLREFAASSQFKSNYSFGRGQCGHPFQCEIPVDENIPLVAGLWLFSESIVVPVLDAGASRKTLVDLSAHRPQLCVYDLP